ncbi:MAG TPA: dihydroneopterin aldolase [Alphaproteobacteria bacterium]|nr:dihydroneopterin aldolase [Alphaproteobacteria bacterium]
MIVKIKNLTIEGILGIYEFEQRKKQRIVVNLEIDFDEGDAPKTDSIHSTMNYHPICDGIRKMLAENNFQLVERVVYVVGQYVLSYAQVRSVKVEIDKPDAPIEGLESVSVSEFYQKQSNF